MEQVGRQCRLVLGSAVKKKKLESLWLRIETMGQKPTSRESKVVARNQREWGCGYELRVDGDVDVDACSDVAWRMPVVLGFGLLMVL
jgi:hypothetical protein